MEKNNGKIIAIVALVVAVVALSVGFAAFADTLTIDGQATAESQANPFDDSTNGLAYKSGSAKCFVTGDANETAIAGADAGTASGDTWSGISVPLTATNPSVTCTAVVENKTSYTAYLRNIYTTAGLTCGSSGANATTNANNVCAGASVEVQIGSVAADKITITNAQTSNTGTTGSIAATNGTATVTVKITYNPEALTDEDVTITLPTISHDYASVATGTYQ